MKGEVMGVFCVMAGIAMAQSRDNFLLQQTQQEMQRVGGQVDMLQNNFDELQRRVQRLEGGGDAATLQNEIQALKASVAEIRRELSAQRNEIVRDLSGRIAKMQPAAQPKPKPIVVTGAHREYVVQSGDTLSFISSTFNVPLGKIKEMNGLKSDVLRVGQKIVLPEK